MEEKLTAPVHHAWLCSAVDSASCWRTPATCSHTPEVKSSSWMIYSGKLTCTSQSAGLTIWWCASVRHPFEKVYGSRDQISQAWTPNNKKWSSLFICSGNRFRWTLSSYTSIIMSPLAGIILIIYRLIHKVDLRESLYISSSHFHKPSQVNHGKDLCVGF